MLRIVRPPEGFRPKGIYHGGTLGVHRKYAWSPNFIRTMVGAASTRWLSQQILHALTIFRSSAGDVGRTREGEGFSNHPLHRVLKYQSYVHLRRIDKLLGSSHGPKLLSL